MVIGGGDVSSLEEKKSEMAAEIIALMDWAHAESDKVIAKLKSEHKVLGLGGHQEEFAYIRETEKRRLKEIVDKYNLPLKTKLNLL